MDRKSFPMDIFDPLTLHDVYTRELSLQIAGLGGAVSPASDDKEASGRSSALFSSPGRHPWFSIFVITGGKGRALRDGAAFSFSAPCLLCFSIYQPYTIEPDGELRGLVLNFHPGFFCLFEHRHEVSCNGVLFNNLYDTPVVDLEPGACQPLLTLAGQIKDELARTDNPDKDILISFLKVFLIHASRIKMAQQEADTGETQKMAPMVVKLRAAIEEHFKTMRQAGDYENLLHVSAAVLNKASKQYFHKTLTALIAERMVIEAKRQLYLTAKPVKEIAFELGYTDEFYFSRFFKKNVGVSPQVFREKVGFDKFVN